MSVQVETLRRELGWLQGAAMTVGAVLGSGVLVLPVAAAQIAGPASLISWLFMGILAIPLATVLGILGSHYPDAGALPLILDKHLETRQEPLPDFYFWEQSQLVDPL